MIVKRYSNRRLYDTSESRYITQQELADKIRSGAEARVVDAKSNEDLTQQTLVQIIIESRGAGKMLPVPLLMHLIRLGDEALAEFLGRYMTTALEMYLQLKRGAQAVSPYNPFASMPFDATSAFARMLLGASQYLEPAARPSPPPAPAFTPQRNKEVDDEMAALRRELEEIKKTMRKKRTR